MPANERDKEREKENGQRREREIQREKKFSREKKSQNANRWAQKERRLFSHLRRFCTRRWLLFGTARLPRRPCSSVRLSICPSFFFPFLYEAIFLLLEIERSREREKNPKPYYAFYSNPLGKLYTTTTSKNTHTHTHIKIFSLIDESETQKRAVVDGSVHGGTIGGVRARERVSFDV